MMHSGVGVSYHVDSWLVYASVMYIFAAKAVILGIAEMGQHFDFDLTCDVIGEAEVNETWFPATNLPEISNAV